MIIEVHPLFVVPGPVQELWCPVPAGGYLVAVLPGRVWIVCSLNSIAGIAANHLAMIFPSLVFIPAFDLMLGICLSIFH